jgi:hypothetical protein
MSQDASRESDICGPRVTCLISMVRHAKWQAMARIRREGFLRWEAPMEKTLADIDADIASLRSNMAKYSKVAEERKARGHLLIAEKQMEFVADLEARVARLEALAKSKALAS